MMYNWFILKAVTEKHIQPNGNMKILNLVAYKILYEIHYIKYIIIYYFINFCSQFMLCGKVYLIFQKLLAQLSW